MSFIQSTENWDDEIDDNPSQSFTLGSGFSRNNNTNSTTTYYNSRSSSSTAGEPFIEQFQFDDDDDQKHRRKGLKGRGALLALSNSSGPSRSFGRGFGGRGFQQGQDHTSSGGGGRVGYNSWGRGSKFPSQNSTDENGFNHHDGRSDRQPRTYQNRRDGGNDGRGRRNEGGDSNWRQSNGTSHQEENGFSSESSTISVLNKYIGRIIGKGGSKIRELEETSGAKIKIKSSEANGFETPIDLIGGDSECEKARSLIEELTTDAPREDTRTCHKCGKTGHMARECPDDNSRGFGRNNSFEATPKSCFKCGESGHVSRDCPGEENQSSEDFYSAPKIDWAKLNEEKDFYDAVKWKDCPPLKKNFYFEDHNVANMHPDEAEEFRSISNNISVTDMKEKDPRPIPNPVRTFEEAFLHYPDILEEIRKQGFQKPSPIQCQAWPILLQGMDMIGIAQTGTGKTLAFLLPALIHIEGQSIPREERGGANILVMTPTRELALQIQSEVRKYSYRGIKCCCVYGGGDRRQQIRELEDGVEILIATPGRLNDLVMNGYIDVKAVTYLVLDEADRMLDMGFEPQIMKTILDIRPDRQTVMTSATWPEQVRRIGRRYLKDPMTVFVGSLDLAACHSVTQHIEIVEQDDKRDILLDFILNMEPNDKVLVFVGRKSTADDLSSDLCLKDVSCQCIHGDREQYDREQALQDFKESDVRILIATDVASRGLDIVDITHVFNFDFPRNMEEYVHRVGRTGRAGRTGTSITLLTRSDWRSARELMKILREANQEIPVELSAMADRFEAWKERNQDRPDFGRGGRGGGGRGGGGRGGGGRGGRRRDRDENMGFGFV